MLYVIEFICVRERNEGDDFRETRQYLFKPVACIANWLLGNVESNVNLNQPFEFQLAET